MPTLDQLDCHRVFQMDPSPYDASCRVAMNQGETFVGCYVRIYPAGQPGTFLETNLGQPNQQTGVCRSTYATPPPNTTGPYKAKFRIEYTIEALTNEIDVT